MAGTEPAFGPAVPARPGRGLFAVVSGLFLAAGLLAAIAGRLPGAPAVHAGDMAVLLLLLVLAGGPGLEFRTLGAGDTLDLFEAALAVGLLALPAPALLPLVAVTKALTLGAQRVPAYKVLFNVAQWTCATAAGALVMAVLRGAMTSPTDDLLLLVPALLVVSAVNTGAVLAVLTLQARGVGLAPSRSSLPGFTFGAGLNTVLALTLGLLFSALWAWQPAAWPVLPVVLAACHLAARSWAHQHIATSRLVGLQRAAAALAGPEDVQSATRDFLSELVHAFSCRGVELRLRAPPDVPSAGVPSPGVPSAGEGSTGPGRGDRDPWLRMSAGDSGPAAAAEPLLSELFRRGRSQRLPPRRDPVLTGLHADSGWQDALAVPVRVDGRLEGLLCTFDRQGWDGFEAGELAVLEAAASVLGEALHRGALSELVTQEREALRSSEARWRALVQNASDLVLVVDSSDVVTYVSPACRPMLGRAESALRGTPLLELVHEADRPCVRQALGELRAEGGRRRLELRVLAHGGDWRLLEVVVSDLLGDGAVDALVLNARDVTQRRRVEAVHADQARVLELVAGGAPLSTSLAVLAQALDEQSHGLGTAVFVDNPGQPALLVAPGLPGGLAEAVGRLLDELLEHSWPDEPRSGAIVLDLGALEGAQVEPLLAAGVHVVRIRELRLAVDPAVRGAMALCCGPAAEPGGNAMKASEGDDHWLLDSASRVATLAVEHSLVQSRLAHQAAHDSLTDLPNRAVFLDRLGRALYASERGERRVLVLFLDIDRFKVVNDSLGHRAGDALLRAVAERLRQAVRPSDTVARFGGDEFTMLCEDISDEAHAVRVVERIREALAKPFPLGDSELFATTSIGIALASGTSRSPDTLVEDADAAMYRAKERGGNCFELIDGAMRNRALVRLDTQSALHRALERGEFRVYYQPTVDLRSGRVVGVEALARWDRPERGVVLPDDFIPLAEETGLILGIGAQVLEQACRQAAVWRGRRRSRDSPAVHVNLSARQLTDRNLVDLVGTVLRRHDVDPASLILEITESSLMHDVSASTATLHQLKALGVRLFVDDFGTGYSSLSYLQKLPVDGVKVDKSFVADLGRTPDAEVIVRAVVGLASALGLEVIAEGVETADQVHRLLDLDCALAQGFFLGRPMPPRSVSLHPRLLVLPPR